MKSVSITCFPICQKPHRFVCHVLICTPKDTASRSDMQTKPRCFAQHVLHAPVCTPPSDEERQHHLLPDLPEHAPLRVSRPDMHTQTHRFTTRYAHPTAPLRIPCPARPYIPRYAPPHPIKSAGLQHSTASQTPNPPYLTHISQCPVLILPISRPVTSLSFPNLVLSGHICSKDDLGISVP